MIHKPLVWLSRLPLFSRKQPIDTTWEVIKWWEVRRIPFNLIVGATGLLTCVVILGIAFVCETITGNPVGLPDPPIFALFAIIAYGIMGNVCYTGGWVVELLTKRVWNERAEAFGEISFTWGMLFAVGLTLLPAALIGGLDAILIIAHVLRH